jgi:anti-sigma regulatory factor (Ser/Thr protein kinase)
VDRQRIRTDVPERPKPGVRRWAERPFPTRGSRPRDGEEWRFSLEPTAQAPGLARDGIAPLCGRLSAERMADARLLVSELVTNSVVHAGSGNGRRSIEVHVRVLSRSAAVCVVDGGPGFDPDGLVASRPGVPGRRGLEFVARLADRFGIAGRRPFRMWFEVNF